MFADPIQKLIEEFKKFPTVGQRTASRFVFYLINQDQESRDELAKKIQGLGEKIKLCPQCFNPFESTKENLSTKNELCPICSDPQRDKSILCVVEKEIDLETLEKTNKFRGLYFILGGTLSTFHPNNKTKKISQRTQKLLERLNNDQNIKEVILALNPTPEGQITSLWLQRKIKPLGIKTTQLGYGLPMGGELEYADEKTLTSALENRK